MSGEGKVILTLKGDNTWEDFFVFLMKMAWKRSKKENEKREWQKDWIKGALEIIKFEAKEGIRFFIGDDEEVYYEKVGKI